MSRRSAAVAAFALLAAGATQLRAQRGLELAAGVSASTAQVARDGFVTSELTGPLLGASGRVGFRRFALSAAYAEGELTPVAGALGNAETLAELAVALLVDVGAGVSLGGGPRARAFLGEATTVRWMRFEARARYEREVIPGLATADLDLWQVLSSDVNAQGGSDGGRGARAGLTFQLPNSPFALRAAYTADRMAYANGTAEFLDHVEVGLRFRRD